MLPQQQKDERYSLKIINGQQFKTVHYWPVDTGNANSAGIYETIDGGFIGLDGNSITNRSNLEALPEQHAKRALAWFDRRGITGDQNSPVKEGDNAQGGVSVESRLLDAVLALTDQVKAIRADVDDLKSKPRNGGPPRTGWKRGKAAGIKNRPLRAENTSGMTTEPAVATV